MLESPDYFFRVREIGRLRQTTASPAGLRAYTNTHARKLATPFAVVHAFARALIS